MSMFDEKKSSRFSERGRYMSFAALFLLGSQILLIAVVYRMPEAGSSSAEGRNLAGRELATAEASPTCMLLGGTTAKKPQPSLTHCYKHNTESCCVAGHDDAIGDAIGEVLPSGCVRQYPDLEEYMCLGCDPKSDSYITYFNGTAGSPAQRYVDADVAPDPARADTADVKKAISSTFGKVSGKLGEIRVCAAFAKRLMYSEKTIAGSAYATNGLDAYDGCALKLGGGTLGSLWFHDGKDDGTTEGIVENTAEAKFFQQVRPKYFGTDDFEISWYHVPTAATPCFGAASGLQVGSMAVAIVAALSSMLA